MYITLWINTVVCVIGIALGLFLAVGSIVSIANMKVAWAGGLVIAAMLVPLAFLISGIGGWWAYAREAKQLIVYLIAFPWVYAAGFGIVMLLSLKL